MTFSCHVSKEHKFVLLLTTLCEMEFTDKRTFCRTPSRWPDFLQVCHKSNLKLLYRCHVYRAWFLLLILKLGNGQQDSIGERRYKAWESPQTL